MPTLIPDHELENYQKASFTPPSSAQPCPALMRTASKTLGHSPKRSRNLGVCVCV